MTLTLIDRANAILESARDAGIPEVGTGSNIITRAAWRIATGHAWLLPSDASTVRRAYDDLGLGGDA